MENPSYSLPYPRKRIARFCIRAIFRFLLLILFRVELRGRKNFPKKGPLLVVGNHTGAMEVILLNAYSPRQIEMLSAADTPVEQITDYTKAGGFCKSCIKPGGHEEKDIYLVDLLEEHEKELTLKYDYFHTPEPMEFKIEGTYAEKDAKVDAEKEYEWVHSLSDIINALLKAGLKLEYLNEYPITVYDAFPFAKQDKDSYYRLKDQKAEIPLIFIIRATK